MSARLVGKIAVVTGGGRGIGRAEALCLASEGALIAVSDFGVNEDGSSRAENVVAEIENCGGKAIAIKENLMVAHGAERTVQAAVEAFGGLDIIVNNAGLRGGNPVHKLTEEQWDSVVDSHLKATFFMCKYGVPELRKRGGGVIINTGSESGLGMLFNSAYAAAKEGIAGFTRSMAREQGRCNIRCNMIRPRATAGDTGGGDWFEKKLAGDWSAFVKALGPNWIGDRGNARWDIKSLPDSIAAFVTWLCTSAAENINGQDFFVGGDEITLLTPPQFSKSMFRSEGWTVDALDQLGASITSGLENAFKVPNPFTNDD